MNKIDLAGLEPGVERDEYGKIRRIRVSARTGDGLGDLRAAISETAAARASVRGEPAPEALFLQPH